MFVDDFGMATLGWHEFKGQGEQLSSIAQRESIFGMILALDERSRLGNTLHLDEKESLNDCE